MKRIWFSAIGFWLLALCVSAQTTHDWENPAVLGINKLPYHATLQLPSKWKECKEIVSLDGQWLFHWSRNPEERPADFYMEDYDVSSWDKIAVPGNQPYHYAFILSFRPQSASLSSSRFTE